MEFTPITLESKHIIQGFLDKDFFSISDISFGNLFIWSCARDISYAIDSDTLIIKTQYPDAKPYFFYPIGAGDKPKALESIAKYCCTHNIPPHFESIESKNLESLQAIFPNLKATPNIDRFDYVYAIQELIELSGRKFHKKKNHLNQFVIAFPNWQYESITARNTKRVIEAADRWLEANPNKSQALLFENIGIKNALQFFEELSLKGGFIHLDGEIIAFSFGEEINNEMAIIHIEKANNEIAGAYQIINQQVLANEFKHLKYANREEDLGIEGLRRAKKSYNPIFMVEKFSLQ